METYGSIPIKDTLRSMSKMVTVVNGLKSLENKVHPVQQEQQELMVL